MALSREAYQAMEEVVGVDNISDDPAILDSYAFQMNAELKWKGSKFGIRPEAAIVPGSTEEVQAIVKICNRYKIKAKAYSTGWGTYSDLRSEGAVQLDMRRMNRILEIDEQNMFAVVEPYVVCSQLQAEAMKVGLNCHMIGAGASCSALAVTTYGGPGPDTLFMGVGFENLLGLEWVMPTGDVLRTGSLGSGLGWFCGEGPGPSLRGLARGGTGLEGGLGIFTKCAIKLSPWPGPAVMPVEGTAPAYNSPLPENFSAYTLAFPSWQAYADAYYQIFDAEIGYIAHKQFPQWGNELQAAIVKIVTDPNKQMCDLEELLKTPEIQKMTSEMRYSFQLVLAGMTLRDIEYQEESLNEILAETRGWKVAKMSTPHMERWMLLYLIKLCFKGMNWITGGGFSDTFSIVGTPDMIYGSGLTEMTAELQRKKIITDKLVDHGGESGMSALECLGLDAGISGLEPFVFYDPHDVESSKAALEALVEGDKFLKERGLRSTDGSIAYNILPNGKEGKFSTRPDVYRWQRKIKEVFDPYGLSDGSYLYLEEPGE